LQGDLLALRLREVETETGTRTAHLSERDLALQSAIAGQRSVEASIERARQQHDAQSELLSGIQGRYYEVGAEISRGEQAIEHAREIRQRQRQELEQISQGSQEAEAHRVRDRQLSAELAAALAELGPALETAREAERTSAGELEAAERAMQDWQGRWEDFNTSLRETSSTAEAERARLEELDAQLNRLIGQRDRARDEHGTLSAADTIATLAELESAENDAAAVHEQARSRVQQLSEDLQQARARERDLAQSAQGARRETQELEGRMVSLEALQRAALGQSQGQVVDWLQARGLEQRPRLAQQLSVDPGWERAVETVLGSYLEAVCVDSIDDVATMLESLASGTVSFFAGEQASHGGSHDSGSLRARVRGPAGLDPLFEGVYAAENLAEALATRTRLRPGESVIARDGIWIGPDWLRVSRDKDAHEGVIEREQALRQGRAELEAMQQRQVELESDLEVLRAQIRDLEDRVADGQAEVSNSGAAHMGLRSRLDGLRAKAEQRSARVQQLVGELAEVTGALETASEGNRAARARLETAVNAMAELEERRIEQEAERDDLRQRLAMARERAGADRDNSREIAMRIESRRSSHESLLASIGRVEEQMRQFQARRTALETQLADGERAEHELREKLDDALKRRVTVEQELASARQDMETLDADLRALDEQRVQAESTVQGAREQLENARFAVQELKVRRESLLEQFAHTRLELAEVVEGLAAEASVAAWEEQLTETSGKIERLGQVNLAAIEEFEEQSERKEYLDRQFADLTDALGTLDEAIRKIDKETKSRFQDTFDKVNAGLKEKFPRLFGGGHAYLELTGDDVLNAGVAIMARPPGKRNSSINQLSGGEKALTAVALVFAIFELNPAPFCLLDEVDAPLDDANVGRFCEIVRDMSSRVQFVFVTHNKSTMEIASQLLGVTMHEPGVSRLVAVDVDEAVRMASM
jgi:chromosome segregation protein